MSYIAIKQNDIFTMLFTKQSQLFLFSYLPINFIDIIIQR